MPEAVADGEEPPPVVPRVHVVVLVEIGHVGEAGGQAVLVGGAEARADGVLDVPEALGEGELLLVVDVLVVKDEHRVLVHAGMDRVHLFLGQRLGHVHAFNLGGEARPDLSCGDGHGGGLPMACAYDSGPGRACRFPATILAQERG